MLEVLFAELLCDFEVARVESGHEVRIDKKWRNNVGLSSLEMEIPKGVENLDVAAGISTQPVLLHECGHSLGSGVSV